MWRGEERTVLEAAGGQGAAGTRVWVWAVLGLEEKYCWQTIGGLRPARGVAAQEAGWAPTARTPPWEGGVGCPQGACGNTMEAQEKTGGGAGLCAVPTMSKQVPKDQNLSCCCWDRLRGVLGKDCWARCRVGRRAEAKRGQMRSHQQRWRQQN